MRKPASCLAFTLVYAAAAFGQFAPPANTAQADPAVIVASQQRESATQAREWLLSSDSRLQAWGAYLASHNRSTDLTPQLLTLLNAYVEQGAADKDRHDAMIAVLDALIELHVDLKPQDAARIYAEFPAQSLILLARSRSLKGSGEWDDELRGVLLNIFKTETKHQGAWLAAGNLLASPHGFRPASGFAAAVVNGMTLHAQITVTTTGGVGGGSGGGFGGDSGAGGPRHGWPEVGSYAILNCGNQNADAGDVLLADGADPVYYRRVVDASYGPVIYSSGSCLVSRDAVREHYISTLVHAQTDSPPLKSQIYHSIVWKDEEAYASELLGFVQQQQQKVALVIGGLQQSGLLTPDEAALVRPTLAIEIVDARSSKTSPLPEVAISSDKLVIKKVPTQTPPPAQ